MVDIWLDVSSRISQAAGIYHWGMQGLGPLSPGELATAVFRNITDPRTRRFPRRGAQTLVGGSQKKRRRIFDGPRTPLGQSAGQEEAKKKREADELESYAFLVNEAGY